VTELLLVGIGVMGRPYLAAARAIGVAVRAVESESWDAGTDLPELDVHRVTDLREDCRDVDELWVRGAYQVIAGGSPDGILAFAEPHVLGAALAQDLLGLPGPSLHAAVLSRNKALQRGCFGASGLPQPAYLLAPDPAAGMEWAAARLPVVIKPLSSYGSVGVEFIADEPRLRAVVAQRSGRILFEEAVDGPEYSWEAFVRDGEILFDNITAKETTGPPHFVEITHRTAHSFADPKLRQAVDALASGVVTAMAMRTGVVHLEFRVARTGPVIMEVAVRTPGDYLLDLIAATYGFSPYQVAVQLALGLQLDLELPRAPTAYAAIWYPTCPPGEVKAIEGLTEVAEHPSVLRVALKVGVGDVVPLVESSGQRPGHVLIASATPRERDVAIETVQRRLQIHTA
jgi:biotin carboxylase